MQPPVNEITAIGRQYINQCITIEQQLVMIDNQRQQIEALRKELASLKEAKDCNPQGSEV